MNCKIAICDDCTADAQYLSPLVADWAKAQGSPVVVKEFPSADRLSCVLDRAAANLNKTEFSGQSVLCDQN